MNFPSWHETLAIISLAAAAASALVIAFDLLAGQKQHMNAVCPAALYFGPLTVRA